MRTASCNTATYLIEEAVNTGGFAYLAVVNAPTLSLAISGRANATYQYHVMACPPLGSKLSCSPNSADLSVVVNTPFTLQPPSGVAAAGDFRANQTYRVQWNAVSGATHYIVHEIDLDQGTESDFTVSAALQRNFSHVVVGSEFDYAVRSCINAACSVNSTPNVRVKILCPTASCTPQRLLTTINYIHTDQLGSPIAETNSSGVETARFNYEPYGQPLAATPLQGPSYIGHVYDASSGLIYMQARFYDPLTGRFLSTDPAASEFNRYAYGSNNPYKFVDPDGRTILLADRADKGRIETMINKRAQGTFKFDDANELQMVKAGRDNPRRSNYYKSKLLEAIKSAKTINVDIAQEYGCVNSGCGRIEVNSVGGGLVEPLENGDTNLVVSGDSNSAAKDSKGKKLLANPEDILFHEFVGHAIPMVVGTDTGNAVENENKVRAEIKGMVLREADPLHRELER
jgi:RHS repeat-associated protein